MPQGKVKTSAFTAEQVRLLEQLSDRIRYVEHYSAGLSMVLEILCETNGIPLATIDAHLSVGSLRHKLETTCRAVDVLLQEQIL